MQKLCNLESIHTPNFVVSFLEVTAVVSKKQVLILLARECIIMSQPPKSASSLQTPYAKRECIRCQFVPSLCVTSLSSNLDLSSSCQAASNQVVSCRSTGRRLMCAICKKEKNLETSTLSVEVASKVAHVGSSTKWWSDHGHPHQYLWITTMSTHDVWSLRSRLINRLIIEYISVISYIDPGVELLASSKIWCNLDFCSLIYNLELWVESVLRCQRSASNEPSSTLKTGHLHVEMFFNQQPIDGNKDWLQMLIGWTRITRFSTNFAANFLATLRSFPSLHQSVCGWIDRPEQEHDEFSIGSSRFRFTHSNLLLRLARYDITDDFARTENSQVLISTSVYNKLEFRTWSGSEMVRSLSS